MIGACGLQMKYKSELTAMREMRKHVAWYTAGYPHSAQLRAAVNEVQSMEELEQLLEGGTDQDHKFVYCETCQRERSDQ